MPDHTVIFDALETALGEPHAKGFLPLWSLPILLAPEGIARIYLSRAGRRSRLNDATFREKVGEGGSIIPPGSPAPHSAAPTVHPTHNPLYPALASAYAGTVVDLMTNEKTALYLTAIEQSGGRMHGFFQGLGLAGSFQGVLTPSGHVQFWPAVAVGDKTIAFDGDIKIGGDMAGNFDVVDRQGYRTGEYGLWNVAPVPH